MEENISELKESLVTGTVSLATFIQFIGHLTPTEIQISDAFIKSTLKNLNPCLKWCFHNILRDEPEESSKNVCKICVILHSQLCHFGNCMAKLYQCSVCLQLYRLLIGHMELCRKEEPQRAKASSSDICFVLLEAMGVEGVSSLSERLWFRLKKAASEIVVMQSSVTPSTVSGQRLDEAGSHLENTTPQYESTNTHSWRTSSSFKRAVNSEDSQLKSEELISEHSVQGLDRQPRSEHANRSQSLNTKSRESVSYPDISSVEKNNEEIHRNWLKNMKHKTSSGSSTQDPYDTQKTYGESGLMSLPLVHNFNQGGQRFNSLETRPVGQPGIGEVVYGTREQLRIVADHWSKIKENLNDAILPNQTREEGVIISKYKKQLRILRTLYQKHYQWERLSHLGTGAAGKCHLAMDLTSKFKFCMKRLNIHNYAKEELTVWCDLEHENIVHLFGALRQGENIYILSEFIDGGNLTACINEQKAMNRRLSHVMALTYFRQLLQVLVYLKSKGILHEDLKSDNILLRRGSTSIAVCDFGLARYITQEKDFKGQCPSGTPTQWSPEKAASYGHGFPSEIWASVCVLVHIMSGDPPWLKRYGNAAMLHFIIFQKSPPIEDVPPTVREEMLDLIKMGFAVEEKNRPSAEILLKHPVFTEIGIHGEPDKYFSILGSERQQVSNGWKQQMDVIVENFQEIIVTSGSGRAEVAAQATGLAGVSLSQKVQPGDRLPKFKIRQEVLDASARFSQTTYSQSENFDSHNLPKLSILEQINSENDDQTLFPTVHLQTRLNQTDTSTTMGLIHPSMQKQENCDNTNSRNRGENEYQPSIPQPHGGPHNDYPKTCHGNMDNFNSLDLFSSPDEETNTYQKFMEDNIDMQTINGYKPTLTLFKNPNTESMAAGKMVGTPADCVPCDSRKNTIKDSERPISSEEIAKHEPLSPPTYLRNQKGLHLNITKSVPNHSHQDLPMQSAPVRSSFLSKKIPPIPQTASAISDGYSSCYQREDVPKKTATKSSAERNIELEEERVKLLAKLPIHDQLNPVEMVENEKLEDWECFLERVRNGIPDQKSGLLRFWDESGTELLCSVKTDALITEWKDLFDTSPIVQRLQEKNVHHFTVCYITDGVMSPVDHLEPIDKDVQDLNISPTTPESPDCWCPLHLNV